MIPMGTDALSPAPQHDIYSIEDLAQLIYALKEATNYTKPMSVKIAAVHNVGSYCQRHGASRRGYHRPRRAPRRHRRGPQGDP